jgi:S-DNA-T family DNA segregation ATPase FtsK/SpoIIIE
MDGPEGKRLDIVITEAKFVRYEQAAAAAKESGRQLRDSLELLEHALFGEPACIDQDLWLARISDLLLEGIQNLGHNIDIQGWRNAIRKREFRLNLRGQSHVFIHSPPELENEGQRFTGVKGCYGQQEVFSRRSLQAIISGFHDESQMPSVTELRLALSGLPPDPKAYRAVPKPTAKPPPQKKEGEQGDATQGGPAGPQPHEPPPTPPGDRVGRLPITASPTATPPSEERSSKHPGRTGRY